MAFRHTPSFSQPHTGCIPRHAISASKQRNPGYLSNGAENCCLRVFLHLQLYFATAQPARLVRCVRGMNRDPAAFSASRHGSRAGRPVCVCRAVVCAAVRQPRRCRCCRRPAGHSESWAAGHPPGVARCRGGCRAAAWTTVTRGNQPSIRIRKQKMRRGPDSYRARSVFESCRLRCRQVKVGHAETHGDNNSLRLAC